MLHACATQFMAWCFHLCVIFPKILHTNVTLFNFGYKRIYYLICNYVLNAKTSLVFFQIAAEGAPDEIFGQVKVFMDK